MGTQVFYGNIVGGVAGRDIVRSSLRENGNFTSGSGKIASQPRELPAPFDALDLTDTVSFEFVHADKCAIEVIADDNLIDLIQTQVIGGVLQVGIEPGHSIQTASPLRVRATGPAMHSVVLSGTGDVDLDGLAQPELRIELRGTGSVLAQGSVSTMKMILQGTGNIDTSRIKAQKVAIKLSGTGDVSAHAEKEAKVSLSGTGNVRLKGNPMMRDVKHSGLGRVLWK